MGRVIAVCVALVLSGCASVGPYAVQGCQGVGAFMLIKLAGPAAIAFTPALGAKCAE